jgi:hypothetical protein
MRDTPRQQPFNFAYLFSTEPEIGCPNKAVNLRGPAGTYDGSGYGRETQCPALRL